MTGIFVRVLGLLRPIPGRTVAMIGLALITVWLTTLLPQVTKWVIDAGLVTGDQRLLIVLSGLLLVVALLRWICHVGRRLLTGEVAIAVQTDLRDSLTGRALTLEPAWYDGRPVGSLLSTWNADVHAVRKLLSFGVTFLVIDTATVVLIVVQMWLLSPATGLIATALPPVLLAVTAHYNRRAQPVADGIQNLAGRLASVVEQNATNFRVVRTFGAERLEVDRYRGVADELMTQQVTAARLRVRYPPLMVGVVEIGVAIVLWLGGHLVLTGDFSLGALVAATTYLGMLTWPVQSLFGMLGTVHQGLAGARRVFGVLDRTSGVTSRLHAQPLPVRQGTGARLTYRAVRTDRLTAGYFDLDLAPGERVAVVGPSGSGKSTLAALTTRFLDAESGQVLLDGLDIRDLTVDSVRRAVVVVSAEPVLLTGTLRENLMLGRPGAADDTILAALHTAAGDDIVAALPDGLDTVLGPDQGTLSGGQSQRVALARALLARPRVLILDEALSQVDSQTERSALSWIAREFPDMTLLMFTQRPVPLAHLDRVVTLAGEPNRASRFDAVVAP